jgi:hypothetical protein
MQLYLDEEVWEALRVRSRQSGLTISELVKRAVRDRYLAQNAKRRQAMQALMGIRQGRADVADPEAYIRALRRGKRL